MARRVRDPRQAGRAAAARRLAGIHSSRAIDAEEVATQPIRDTNGQ
jgi:hypothetical protein